MANNYQSSLSRYKRYVESVRSRPLWRATLYLTLSLVLLIVLVVTALRPTVVTIAKLVSDIDKQKELNSRLENKIRQIQKAQEAYADPQVSGRITLLDLGLPADPRFGSLAERVQTMAIASGLVLKNIEVGEIGIKPAVQVGGGDAANMGMVNFEIRVEGEYGNLKRFVVEMENWRRLINIKKIVINKIETANTLEANISGVAGYADID